ncbi:C-_U-editing enzyme APOBEC-2a isoform X2 [Festucalex cinctus]
MAVIPDLMRFGAHSKQLEQKLFYRVLFLTTLIAFFSDDFVRDRIDPLAFKFQFKNVEYSSGRNKTFLCYLVDKGKAADGLLRGCLEDEHSGPHAEDAFFTQCLSDYDPSLKYAITWYMSSSPCAACAAKIAEVLNGKKNIKMSIFASRLFELEEAEIQAGLKALHKAGCKLRMMKPLDFSYTWDTFVENMDQPLNLWEDCKDNYEYYHEKLSDILQCT